MIQELYHIGKICIRRWHTYYAPRRQFIYLLNMVEDAAIFSCSIRDQIDILSWTGNIANKRHAVDIPAVGGFFFFFFFEAACIVSSALYSSS